MGGRRGRKGVEGEGEGGEGAFSCGLCVFCLFGAFRLCGLCDLYVSCGRGPRRCHHHHGEEASYGLVARVEANDDEEGEGEEGSTAPPTKHCYRRQCS